MDQLLVLDIGGTFTKVAYLTIHESLIDFQEIKTPNNFEDLLNIIDQYVDARLQGIAISAPGSVRENGSIKGYSAVPFIHQINIKKELTEKYHVPIIMENDANCAAIAELFDGAGLNLNSFACLVCGTGIGGALVINRQLFKGANVHSGEFGYMIMDHTNGLLQTWSDLGSSSALSRRLNHVPPYGNVWTGYNVFELAEKGHKEASASLDLFYKTLAIGIFNLQYAIDPEAILIGGGITRQPSFLKKLDLEFDAIFQQLSYASIKPNVEICHHLDHAQLVGAGYLWKQSHKRGDKIVY